MNRLPIACDVRYQQDFLSIEEADRLYTELMSQFDLTDRTIQMHDGTVVTAETGVYMFADPELTSFEALPQAWGGRAPWPSSLVRVRERVFHATGVQFQVARSVYYMDGTESMGFHSDLPAYGDTSAIASLSLGAEREFLIRNKTNFNEQHSIRLAPGSLLFMGKGCQEDYEHALPYDETCRLPRLNLTFRKYGWN